MLHPEAPVLQHLLSTGSPSTNADSNQFKPFLAPCVANQPQLAMQSSLKWPCNSCVCSEKLTFGNAKALTNNRWAWRPRPMHFSVNKLVCQHRLNTVASGGLWGRHHPAHTTPQDRMQATGCVWQCELPQPGVARPPTVQQAREPHHTTHTTRIPQAEARRCEHSPQRAPTQHGWQAKYTAFLQKISHSVCSLKVSSSQQTLKSPPLITSVRQRDSRAERQHENQS